MKGTYRVIIQNKKIKYDFEVRRSITIIRGDSATGKTVLVDMIREYYNNGEDSGVELHCNKTCVVLEGRGWEAQLSSISDCLVFIDEGNTFVGSRAFASAIQKTDNYYIIVTREGLEMLPYSVSEIYGIRSSGKYGTLKQAYNEMYQIYGQNTFGMLVNPATIVTEDSNAGFEFYEAICKKSSIRCLSAYGKSNIFKILSQQTEGMTLVIADGAAFGSEMGKVMELVHVNKYIKLYLPESFEWLILKSGVIKDAELKNILELPAEYIESRAYFSWERFFTELLINKTDGTYLKYTKNTLNPVYKQKEIADAILNVMDKISLKQGI